MSGSEEETLLDKNAVVKMQGLGLGAKTLIARKLPDLFAGGLSLISEDLDLIFVETT